MNDKTSESSVDPRQQQEQAASTLLTRALKRARLSIFWERLWPALAALATVVGLFIAVSWLGLWLWLPPLGRAIGLGIFALITAAALVPVLRLRVPTAHDGLRRLDRTSGLPHRPATAIADDIANPEEDAWSVALWRNHVERALLAARTLKAGKPMPRLAMRDPVALRALVLVLLVATFFAAGGERGKRLAAAFDWHGVVTPANFRVDAWITPPAYTNRPPILLPGVRAGEPLQATANIAAPEGSTLVIRSTGKVDLDVTVRGGLAEAVTDTKAPAGTQEYRYTLKESGSVTIRGAASDDIKWAVTAIPDRAPTIALAKDPEPQLRGSLKLIYKIEDDYGVTNAKAEFARKDGKSSGHALYGPPDLALSLPHSRTRNGVGQTIKDLTEHPWAGAEVTMTLIARDERGNEGRSKPHAFELPARLFVKPLPRALIEQRRILAMDGDARPQVLVALDALSIAPERFTPEKGVYLGLRTIYWKLARAKTDDALRDVVARLWQMAVDIEDGNLSRVERALRAAQEALRRALERGASDEEIKRLTDQLRAALDRFLKELAQELRKNPQKLTRPLDRNMRALRSQDLRSMIDRLEKLARSGAKDAARRLLDQLQSMLNNLQTARRGTMQDGDMDDDMMSSLDELADIIRKQQQLRDRTFQQGQNQRRQPGQKGQKSFNELQQDQKALRDRLSKLLDELRKRGLGQQPGQKGKGQQNGPLGRAGKAMRDAQGQLGDGNADSAVDLQGRALQALRQGAQSLAQAMQQQLGLGPGPGQPGRRGPQSRANNETDPLGRPLRGREYGDDTTVKVPGEIDVQRARRILEELRKRFGESFRPQLELDYIERLLKDF